MISDDERMSESVRLLNRHFELEQQAAIPVRSDEADLRDRVEKIIRWLMDYDMEKLMQIMYRIDVSEEAFRQAIATSPPGRLSHKIAALVLEREWQKAETRLRYRK
ncbi:MAG: hypothetical protein WBH03_11035 [Cyclobacteriaceae bacterium]